MLPLWFWFPNTYFCLQFTMRKKVLAVYTSECTCELSLLTYSTPAINHHFNPLIHHNNSWGLCGSLNTLVSVSDTHNYLPTEQQNSDLISKLDGLAVLVRINNPKDSHWQPRPEAFIQLSSHIPRLMLWWAPRGPPSPNQGKNKRPRWDGNEEGGGLIISTWWW